MFYSCNRLENYHLTVTLVKEEDGGEYEVRADNEFGSVSSKSTVTVHCEYSNIHLIYRVIELGTRHLLCAMSKLNFQVLCKDILTKDVFSGECWFASGADS